MIEYYDSIFFESCIIKGNNKCTKYTFNLLIKSLESLRTITIYLNLPLL